jgi:hypothetical protein
MIITINLFFTLTTSACVSKPTQKRHVWTNANMTTNTKMAYHIGFDTLPTSVTFST